MRKNDDLISRQDALSFLRNWERVKDYSWGERNIIKATINEIESLPSAQPEPCEDAVSRSKILSYIDRIQNQGTGKKKSFDFIREYVEKMPYVMPKNR